jgi:opacity protein-like surface antigen
MNFTALVTGDWRLGGRASTGAARVLAIGTLVCALNLGTAPDARAQFFVSPFIGYDFGADAGCPNLLICADRMVNAGAAAGRMVGAFGFEEEVAYAKDFFGAAPDLSSSVLTVMSNGIVTRAIGRWRPYAVGGIGLLKTHIQFTQSSFYATDQKNLAWNLGGGVSTYFGRRWGVRADVRYFRSFHDVPLSGFTMADSKLGFGRGTIGLIVRF